MQGNHASDQAILILPTFDNPWYNQESNYGGAEFDNEVNLMRQPVPLTEEEKQLRLQQRQKDTLEKFLARNAISLQQYEAGMKYIEEQGAR